MCLNLTLTVHPTVGLIRLGCINMGKKETQRKKIDKHRNKVDTKYLPKSHLTVSRNLHLKEIMPTIVFLNIISIMYCLNEDLVKMLLFDR